MAETFTPLNLSSRTWVDAAQVAVPKMVEFDGHRFAPWGFLNTPASLSYLEMAYRARRGDAGAIAVLTAFRVKIFDFDHNAYWPVEPDAPTVVE